MKSYGIDLGAIGASAGACTTSAINTVWENCTQENLDKLTAMTTNANNQLKEAGIDVGDLTE